MKPLGAQTFSIAPGMTEMPVTHLIFDGSDGWIEAKRVWVEMPHPEADGAESGPGWEFKTVGDCIRWLNAP